MKAFKKTRNSEISYHDEEDVVFRDEFDKSNEDAKVCVWGRVKKGKMERISVKKRW